jgi:hypothetical protein
METVIRKVWRLAVALIVAAAMLFFGLLVSTMGYQTVREWSSISPTYASCGLLWVVAGLVMLVASLWVLGSLGRSRVPLLVGGAATALAGLVLVVGVLTYVIPCAGPG